ncbi:MAG: hypothetical protein AAFR35_13465 [Pseudomonadota bacterium]
MSRPHKTAVLARSAFGIGLGRGWSLACGRTNGAHHGMIALRANCQGDVPPDAADPMLEATKARDAVKAHVKRVVLPITQRVAKPVAAKHRSCIAAFFGSDAAEKAADRPRAIWGRWTSA